MTYKLDDYVPRGSSLRGYVHARYFDLVEVFGEPNILGEGLDSGDKVWWEWGVQFTKWDDALEDDEPIYATIYDWKETHPDHSRIGKYLWHIGAKSHFGVEMVYATVGQEILDRPVADKSVDEKLFAVRQ